MEEELNVIERNPTWEYVNPLEKQKSIDVKWIYKNEVKLNGKVNKYKERLVAKGFL